MRSGSEFWVSENTAKKLNDQIVNQTKHNFIELTEINRTINTADIVEILTTQQVDDRNRLKNKEWQCAEKKWHGKGQKCFCAAEKAKARRAIEQQKEMEEANRELTPEEEENRKKNFAKTRKFLEDKGILAKKMKI
jgi:hypothetical protein